jgi:putative sigma-54 modulation protein
MQMKIVSKNTEVTPDIRELAEEKISKIDRFLNDITEVELIFIEEQNPAKHNTQVVEATVYVRGTPLKAHGSGLSFHEAIDKVANKLEMQAQKLKGKRVTRYQQRRRDYQSNNWVPIDELLTPDVVNEELEENVQITKTKQVLIKPMSNEEAGLQMDLLAHDFFLFLDEKTSLPSVIYRRKDGHLGVLQGGTI